MVQPPPSNCTMLGWRLEQWDILGGAAQTWLPSFAALLPVMHTALPWGSAELSVALVG